MHFSTRPSRAISVGSSKCATRACIPPGGSLTEALRTGNPQGESKDNPDATFEALYADKDRMKSFLSAMTGISMGNARAIAAKFDWSKYKTFVDVGAAQGCVPVQLATAHKHLTGIGFDLPAVKSMFEEYVAGHQLTERVKFVGGDFFKQDLPHTDVIVMGHILHDWDLPTKRMLLKKAHAAVPSGGAVIVYDAMIDNDRRENTFGLLMSLNMLIETRGGFDYTCSDGIGWMQEAGFRHIHTEPLAGPHSMLVGIK
jgi:precorrin-6B methylase 2